MRRITGMLIAGVGFGGAATMFGVAVVDAISVDTAPHVAAPAETAETPTGVAARLAAPAVEPLGSPVGEPRNPESVQFERAAPGLEAWIAETTSPRLIGVALERAVSQDPFQPDRRAPAQRYVLPGQRSVFAEVETEPTPAPSFRVVGAARIGQGGLALVQVDDGDVPIAVSVGESIEGFRLVSVTDEGATFEGATLTADGANWDLSVVEPREERRNNNNRRNNNRGRNNNNGDAEFERRVQEMIQQNLQLFGPQGRAGFLGRGGGLGGRGVGRGGGGVGRGGRGGGGQ